MLLHIATGRVSQTSTFLRVVNQPAQSLCSGSNIAMRNEAPVDRITDVGAMRFMIVGDDRKLRGHSLDQSAALHGRDHEVTGLHYSNRAEKRHLPEEQNAVLNSSFGNLLLKLSPFNSIARDDQCYPEVRPRLRDGKDLQCISRKLFGVQPSDYTNKRT